jgi:hypothetical protein
MASAGLKAIESARLENEEMVSIVANDACGVGALQCITGCTVGKGNLISRDYGKAVRVVFNFNGRPDGIGEDRNVLTEWILSASQEDILSVSPLQHLNLLLPQSEILFLAASVVKPLWNLEPESWTLNPSASLALAAEIQIRFFAPGDQHFDVKPL